MIRPNPFDGKGAYTKFVWGVYEQLQSRAWFTYADVMEKASGKKLSNSISKCENYGELKKAFRDIFRILEDKLGKGCIETSGNNRNKSFRYIGENVDPLEDLQNAKAINDIKEYAQFCEDSAGFFPHSWLEYFFEDTLDLLNITRRKKNGEQMIASSIDRELDNIHMLPILYKAIRDKKVLTIDYQPYDEPVSTLKVHPHLLKEYNGRWFLFGHAEGKDPEFGYNLAIDRIKSDPEPDPAIAYKASPKGFYDDLFKHVVGVTHYENAKPVEMIIRATDLNVFRLTETKKIHHSQETVKSFGQYEDGEYGEFKLVVELNNELIGRILQMGDGFAVLYPPDVRDVFKRRIRKMADLYCD